jgi:hypothetical protein
LPWRIGSASLELAAGLVFFAYALAVVLGVLSRLLGILLAAAGVQVFLLGPASLGVLHMRAGH